MVILSEQKNNGEIGVSFEETKDKDLLEKTVLIGGLALVTLVLVFNQVNISNISDSLNQGMASNQEVSGSEIDISEEEVDQLSSTAQTVATVFPELDETTNEREVQETILVSGTPEYSDLIGGANFDEVEQSNRYLSQYYYEIKEDVQNNHIRVWNRYLDLVAEPKGVSCEYCCGLDAQAVDENGEMLCGCSHLPSMLAVTLTLMRDTDYSDGEVLREAMNWKAAFFPQDMTRVGAEVAGQDPSNLEDAPGMVGGC